MRERAQKPSLSPAECPEDALICVRRVSIVGVVRLILIRSRENRQQLGKWCKVSILDGCVERLLNTMIARDEGRINGSHCLSACVGLEPFSGQTRSPPRDPTVVGSWGSRTKPARWRQLSHPRQRHTADGRSM